MKIFITGCARSGTTLLQRCCTSFNGIDVIVGEIPIYCLKEGSIGKRTYRTIYSNIIREDKIKDQINYIKENNINIINIIRDGRDVIEDGKVSLRRWVASIKHSFKYNKLLSLQIKYEDLCTYPDKIQKLISNKFELEYKHRFSEYPMFVPKIFFNISKLGKYGKFSIHTKNIHKKGYRKKYKFMGTKKEVLEFENMLRKLKYE